jgi:putative ABC transport system permease protein
MSSTSIRLALQNLRANPLRTTLSVLGIIMGAASLAAVLSIGDGAEVFARQRLEREGVQVVVLTPKVFDTVDGLRVLREQIPDLTAADATAIGAEVGPRYGVNLMRRGGARWQATAAGPLRAAMVVGRLTLAAEPAPTLAAGRDLRADEMAQAAPVALASPSFAEAVAGTGGAAVGRRVIVAGRDVTIVGVTAPTPGRTTLELVVPEGLAASLMMPSRDPQPPAILVRAPTVEDMPALRARLERWAAARYGDRVMVASRGLELLRDIAQGILIFKLLMGAFTAISLLVGGIGIMNVLLASVIERTREIGIRKAIGARQRDVIVQFLTESVTIAIAGSLVGLTLGLVGAFSVTALIRARTQATIYAAVSWETVAISLAAATVTGLCFGVYPAWRAAHLSPVDAMRHE